MTKRNVFSSEQTFIVPLRKPKQEVKEYHFEKLKDFSHIQNKEGSLSFYDQKDKSKNFTYISKQDTEDERKRKVTACPYLLRYIPNKCSKPEETMYFLAVSIIIDKVFDNTSDSETEFNLCTEKDLVYLKQSFFQEKDSLPITDSGKTHREWLKEVLNEYETETRKDKPYFRFSVSNLIVENIETDNKSLTEINQDFTDEYYKPYADGYESTPIKNDERFIYGLMFGNENYGNSDDERIANVLCNGYSNNKYERLYAYGDNIVFIMTHNPYNDHNPFGNENKTREHDVCKTLFLYEMCSVLYLKKKISEIRELLNQEEASCIKKGLYELSSKIGTKLFNVAGEDMKMDYLYERMGVLTDFNILKDISSWGCDAKTLEQNKRTNDNINFLSVITIICNFVMIYQNCRNEPFDMKILIILALVLLIIITGFIIYNINHIKNFKL